MKKVLVFPGGFQKVKNYGEFEGEEIWLTSTPPRTSSPNADFYIGHSIGANFMLSLPYNGNAKYILVNPIIPKRSFLVTVFLWLRFLMFEGIAAEKVVPAGNFFSDFKKVRKLLKVDVLKVLQTIPKENITIIRGTRDVYFCTKKSVAIIKKSGFQVIEVDAGHDWNRQIANTVNRIIS